jgi:hypothetical protein
MRKLSVCTSLLLSIVLSTSAQSHFQPGWIVTEKGDTLHGNIDDPQWRTNPKRIKFRRSEDGSPTQTYGFQDITYFSIDGQDAYIRAFVKEDMSPVDPGTNPVDIRDTVIQDTVFLKVLVTGKRLSLYALTDSKDHYYISDGSGHFDELIYKVRTVQLDNGGTREDVVNEFRHQLFVFLPDQDSVSMAERIESLPFSERPLMRAVKDLNGSSNTTFVNQGAESSFITTQFYLGAGVSTSSLSFAGNDQGAKPMSFNHSAGPVGEFGVDFTSNQKWGDIALRLSVTYWSASFSGTESDGQGTDTYKLSMSTITPSVDVIYSFYKTKAMKLFVGLGVGLNVASYPTSTYVQNDPNIIAQDRYDLHPSPAKSWLNAHYRVGARIKRHFGVEIEAIPTGSLTNSVNFKGKVADYSLKALYYF